MLNALPPVHPVYLLAPLAVLALVCLFFAALQVWLAVRAKRFPFRELMVGLASLFAALGGMLATQLMTRGGRPVTAVEAVVTLTASVVGVVVALLFLLRAAPFTRWVEDVSVPAATAARIARLEGEVVALGEAIAEMRRRPRGA